MWRAHWRRDHRHDRGAGSDRHRHVDDHHGGTHIAPREGSLRIQVREIPESIEGEVTLLRVTLDEAAGPGAVDPTVRPIYLLDRDRRAYDVGYEPLRESEAGTDGMGSGGDESPVSTDGGSGPLPVALVLLAIGLGAALAAGVARR